MILFALLTSLTFGQDLNQIISDYTSAVRKLDAFHAPDFNIEEDLSKFGDYPSPEYFERSKKIVLNTNQKLKTVDFKKLSLSDQRTYRLFKEDIDQSVMSLRFPEEYLAFNQISNRLQSFLDESNPALTDFPFDSTKHYSDFIKRASGLKKYVQWEIELHKKGLQKKIVQSCDVANLVPRSYSAALESDPALNPFYRPAKTLPKNINAKERSQIQNDFKKMIVEQILPAYRTFNDFYLSEYQPQCRKQFGIYGLPHAKNWYAYKIQASTSLKMSAKEIHQLGLEQVKLIAQQISKIQNDIGNHDPIAKFLKSLNQDPKNRFATSLEMMAAFQDIKSRVTTALPKFFSLPNLVDYQVVEASNSEAPIGVYNEPTEYLPFGRFVVNKKSLLKHEAATLSVHEASPGHHLQFALIYQIKNTLSEYQRKLFYCAAFTEGWGLYSEYLGREMGIYISPLEKLGNLNFEMFRAVRLVVDTGIHAYGWNQKKVMEYMSQYLSLDEETQRIEANRYSVWPGQALSYKIGEIKIKQLRAMAQDRLRERFDLKEFHNAVIGSGNVSLSVLESQVEKFISDRLAQSH